MIDMALKAETDPSIERVFDRSMLPRCPSCTAPLPRLVTIPWERDVMLRLRCQGCETEAAFMGPGLLVDRRRFREG
jgi:hypothetical protein